MPDAGGRNDTKTVCDFDHFEYLLYRCGLGGTCSAELLLESMTFQTVFQSIGICT